MVRTAEGEGDKTTVERPTSPKCCIKYFIRGALPTSRSDAIITQISCRSWLSLNDTDYALFGEVLVLISFSPDSRHYFLLWPGLLGIPTSEILSS